MLRRIVNATARRAPAHTAARALAVAAEQPTVWKFFQGCLPNQVPLTEPLPGVPEMRGQTATSGSVKVTKLDNGVSVVTDDSPAINPSLGVFARCGPAMEDDTTGGSSLVLQHAAFQDTSNRSSFRMVRDMEALGLNGQAMCTRDMLAVTGDCLLDSVPKAVDLLADSTLNPRFSKMQFQRAQASAVAEVSAATDSTTVLDAVHYASFGATGLARSLYAPTLESLDAQTVSSFHNATVNVGANLAVVASGVNHELLVSIAQSAFAGAAQGVATAVPESPFVGGEAVFNGSDELRHFAVAFPGDKCDGPNYVTSFMLSVLLGGGDSFSSGGPGKGMTSLLYTNVLCKHQEVASALATSHSYNTGGLFVLQGSCVDGQTSTATEAMVEQLKSVAASISDKDFQRAKATTLSALHSSNEQGLARVEDMGRQALIGQTQRTVAQMQDAINAVTPKDLSGLAASMLSGPFSTAFSGNDGSRPSFDQVSKWVKA
jgi:processing peptidase subunit alpha